MVEGLGKTAIRVKRIYGPSSHSDGARILIDRLLPRGLKKQDIYIDRRLKEFAPSTRLRKWFGHRRERWDKFRQRYGVEPELPVQSCVSYVVLPGAAASHCYFPRMTGSTTTPSRCRTCWPIAAASALRLSGVDTSRGASRQVRLDWRNVVLTM
jgi:uncharacterized protein YeaO (DUF488 family)